MKRLYRLYLHHRRMRLYRKLFFLYAQKHENAYSAILEADEAFLQLTGELSDSLFERRD